MKQWRILCVDFDGVIHDYKKGWRDGVIYGDVTPGFWEWTKRVSPRFRIMVYSSRSKDPVMFMDMLNWMQAKAAEHGLQDTHAGPLLRLEDEATGQVITIEFAREKPSAWLTIDDRAICFKGNWDTPELDPKAMVEFEPWTQQP